MVHIPEFSGELPWLTTDQVRAVYRAMEEDLGITLLQTTENAGRCIADLVRRRCLGCDPRGSSVTVLAGSGRTAAAAMAAARRLSAWGSDVSIRLAHPIEELADVAQRQARTLLAMSVPVKHGPPERSGRDDLVIDAILGDGLEGPPRDAVADMIRWTNDQLAPVLALNLPSGLDATSGEISDPIVRAGGTVCTALPRLALKAEGVSELAGELYLADIGVPPALYARDPLNLTVGPIFAGSEIIQLPFG